MAYMYAALGVVMLSGIMAIFEMALSLTGRSMIPASPDAYFEDTSMKSSDIMLLQGLTDGAFPASVLNKGLCAALEDIEREGWTLISEGRWANSCQLNRGSHRVIVREDTTNLQIPYQLFLVLSKEVIIDVLSNLSDFFSCLMLFLVL